MSLPRDCWHGPGWFPQGRIWPEKLTLRAEKSMSGMSEETYRGILTLVEEADNLKEEAKNRMVNQLADLRAREQSLASRTAKLRDCLYAIAGFKGDERISSGVAAYALELDEHETQEANGRVYPEDKNARMDYARVVVNGFVKMVAKG